MSGTACSFWQKVLMAALSKVLVQVTEQSILRWMRERGRGRERDWNRKVISTFRKELHICNSSSMLTGFQVEYTRTVNTQCGSRENFSTSIKHHSAVQEQKLLRFASCSWLFFFDNKNPMCIIVSCCSIPSVIPWGHNPFSFLTVGLWGSMYLSQQSVFIQCITYYRRSEKTLTCHWFTDKKRRHCCTVNWMYYVGNKLREKESGLQSNYPSGHPWYCNKRLHRVRWLHWHKKMVLT